MNQNQFETAAREQNQRRTQEVQQARATGSACEIVDMLAFGDTFCRTHRVMGECQFGKAVQS